MKVRLLTVSQRQPAWVVEGWSACRYEPGTEVSFLKIRGSEMGQNILEMVMEAVGYYTLPYTPEGEIWGSNEPPIGAPYAALAAPQYFNERKISIFSGSNEIQRNIMSKFMLGL